MCNMKGILLAFFFANGKKKRKLKITSKYSVETCDKNFIEMKKKHELVLKFQYIHR